MYCANCKTPIPDGHELCENCMKGYQNIVNPQSAPDSDQSKTEQYQSQTSGVYNVNYQAQSYSSDNSAGYNPYGQQTHTPEPKKVVTTGQWILRYLINLIPCVGGIIYLVMLFIWMNDKTYEESSSNWAKAQLIWIAISIGIVVLAYLFIFLVLGVTFNELADEMYYM